MTLFGLLVRVPFVWLIFHSSVVTISQELSLIKYLYLNPLVLTLDKIKFRNIDKAKTNTSTSK